MEVQHMAKINLSKAADVVGKDRTTIWRHVKSGKLSVERDRDGLPFVDTSELIRVYGELKVYATPKFEKKPQPATRSYNDLITIIEHLRTEQAEMKDQIISLTYRLTEKPLDIVTESKLITPENDPAWPSEVKSMADICLRKEIRTKYKNT